MPCAFAAAAGNSAAVSGIAVDCWFGVCWQGGVPLQEEGERDQPRHGAGKTGTTLPPAIAVAVAVACQAVRSARGPG